MIVPAINAATFEEMAEKIKLVEPHSTWVHLDAADGTFTKNTLWHSPVDLDRIETKLNIEAHLMMDHAEHKVEEWLRSGIKRILFHIGGTKDPDFIINKCRENNIEVGISISPDESVAKGMVYKDKVDIFQILAVRPGLSGQKTLEETYDRIKEVRNFCPSCIIEVDGGMNKETIPKALEAGADIIVAASAIFESGKGIKETIRELKQFKS